MDPMDAWVVADRLVAQQHEVGALRAQPWSPPDPMFVAGCFVAFARGEQGPGRTGDHAWVGTALLRVEADAAGGSAVSEVAREVVRGRAGGPYEPGLLAMREGPMMVVALRTLFERHRVADVVMVDATGRDHPRLCGLAVHLGWLLEVPTVGVTHRMLTRRTDQPPDLVRRGDTAAVDDVARWVCTRDGVRPVVAHAGWRTGADVAARIASATATVARTPEPLRTAREIARTSRARAALQ